MTIEWIDPIWVSQDYPDAIWEVEGDMCRLDSGLIVISTFSGDGLSQWAINPATNPPTVGPLHFDSSDTDWTTTPGFEVMGPPDPAGYVWGDICVTVPVGTNEWAVTGEAEGDLDNDGIHFPVAAFYTVNPSTLEISRTGIDYHDATDAGYYEDNAYGARWGSKVAVTGQVDVDLPRIAIASQDGSTVILDVPWPGWPDFNNRPGPLAVVGNVVMMFDQTLGISTWDLNGGGQIARITQDIGQGVWGWGMFTCTMSNGKIAAVCSGPYDPDYTDDTLPVKVAIITPSPLAVDTVIDIVPAARSVGWTGGWKSNVRDIGQMPDGTLVVSYEIAHVMYLAFVDPTTETVTISDPLPFEQFGGTTFIARMEVLGQDQFAAAFITSRGDQYGTWYTQTAMTRMIAGELDEYRTRFTGKART